MSVHSVNKNTELEDEVFEPTVACMFSTTFFVDHEQCLHWTEGNAGRWY